MRTPNDVCILACALGDELRRDIDLVEGDVRRGLDVDDDALGACDSGLKQRTGDSRNSCLLCLVLACRTADAMCA